MATEKSILDQREGFAPLLSVTHASTALEWPRMISHARELARTAPAKEYLDDFLDPAGWASSIDEAREWQEETREALALVERNELWSPLEGLEDPRDPLENLAMGRVLDLQDWVNIRGWLYAIDSWAQVPEDELAGHPIFGEAVSSLFDPATPIRALDRILTPSGQLSEKASPKLKGLFAAIDEIKRQIGETLDRLRAKYLDQGVLQEDFTDLRDGRYVLPVKISAQSKVAGRVHETSVSRRTAFMEPREVEELTRRLREQHNELDQEIFRILEETADELRPFGDEISESSETLAYWDSVAARARLARKYSGRSIEVTADRELRLERTAHPLLWWAMAHEDIVENMMELSDEYRMLLISGPNTGGKTVLLKLLGLAAICARTGFAFPSLGRPKVPFFDRIFVDMGDPQSIDQHLSSFSGHVLRLKEILEGLTPHSLVLIDELNSATDPEEGAALGRAFLETLMSLADRLAERGGETARMMIVATTHDPHLKSLALTDSRILNSSMEFDEDSHRPTYRMVLGVPGRSRALEIAESLGIPKGVLDLARSYLSAGHFEAERMIARLEKELQSAEKSRRSADRLREEAEKLKTEYTQKAERTVSDALEQSQKKLKQILVQAEDTVKSRVRELQSRGQVIVKRDTHREVEETRKSIEELAEHVSARMGEALSEEFPEARELIQKASKPVDEPLIRVGTAVRVPKLKSVGMVQEIKGKKARVAMGVPLSMDRSRMTMNIAVTDLQPLTEDEIKKIPGGGGGAKKPKKAAVHISSGDEMVRMELDLRGIRFDDAMEQLGRYLDRAYSAGMPEVTIIHGLGTGALKGGTVALLSKLPYVKHFQDGGIQRGGLGATIVQFDRG